MDNISNLPNNYYSIEELRNLFRLLATQNSMWTRSYIVSVMSNLDDIVVLENRLYMNVIDFSDVFNIYYTKEITVEFESLFREYIGDLIEVTNLLKANYTYPETNTGQQVTNAKEKWNSTGSLIAKFLSNINFYWQFDQFQTLILDHIAMTIDQMQQRLRHEYAYEVHQYDFIEYHSLLIADDLSNGIIGMFY